jgi:hypothetical protein
MGIKLGDISPIAGAITGKGMFGKGMSKLADSGMGMLVPMSYLAQSQRDKRKRKEERAGASEADDGMRKGGKVKKMAKGGKVTRGDGCVKKGHTKGRMI